MKVEIELEKLVALLRDCEARAAQSNAGSGCDCGGVKSSRRLPGLGGDTHLPAPPRCIKWKTDPKGNKVCEVWDTSPLSMLVNVRIRNAYTQARSTGNEEGAIETIQSLVDDWCPTHPKAPWPFPSPSHLDPEQVHPKEFVETAFNLTQIADHVGVKSALNKPLQDAAQAFLNKGISRLDSQSK